MTALTFPLADEQGERLLIDEVGEEAPPTLLNEPRRRVDARGHPLARCLEQTARAMRGMTPGELLEVVTSDAACADGVPAWAEARGHAVLEVGGDGHTYRFLLRVA